MAILKDLKNEISKPLSTLTNLSFDTEIFPDSLKLFKKGDKQNCNNYRPIYVLSNISNWEISI